MGYAVKYKAGGELETGGITRGGFLRTPGGRLVVYKTKKEAETFLDRWVKDYYKSLGWNPVMIGIIRKEFYVSKV